MKHVGKIEITATALEPIVHGAGTSGNSQLLRLQPGFYMVNGKPVRCRTPFISGNSIKHRIREAAIRYAIRQMGDVRLEKAEVDLLFSGGSLTKGGSAVDLSRARRLSELFPPLSLCGYSAGNAMEESKIAVDHMHVVCKENRDRVPDRLRDHPMLELPAGAFQGEEFGTRHDQSTRQVGRRYLTDGADQATAERKSKGLAKKAASADEAKGDSTQMIYDFPVIERGAVLWSAVHYAELTEFEQAALTSAFHAASVDTMDGGLVMHVGAKQNTGGYGKILVQLTTSMRVPPPSYGEVTALAAQGDSIPGRYNEHLRKRAPEIMAAIREAVA